MKARYTVFLPCLLSGLGLLAQPTLNASDMVPTAGSIWAYNSGPHQDQGAPGIDQTWDFSALTYTEQISFLFVAPSSTPNASDFPGATVVQEVNAPSGIYNYVLFSSDGAYALGNDLSGFGYNHFSDPRQGIKFPLTYNDTWSDPFAGDMMTIGSTGTFYGTIEGTADGYGTLVLPYGTFTNVLRVHTFMSTTTTILTPQMLTSTATTDAYLFLKPGLPPNLLEISVATGGSAAIYLNENSNGVEEALMQDIGIEVMPNPATDAISVTYGAAGVVNLAVYDALGRSVLTTNFGRVPPGIHREQLDVSMLARGQYVLSITNADGETGSRRFVIQ